MYVRNSYEIDPEGLEGFWGAIGGAIKGVGKFAVRTVTGIDVDGDEERPPEATVLSDRSGEQTGMPIDDRSFLERLRDRAVARARQDPRLRERIVSDTARYIPPEVLAAAAARQARGSRPVMTAGVVIPALVIGAILLRRR